MASSSVLVVAFGRPKRLATSAGAVLRGCVRTNSISSLEVPRGSARTTSI